MTVANRAVRTLMAAFNLITGRLATSFCSLLTRWRLTLNGAKVGPDLCVRGWIDLRIHRYAKVVIGARCRFKSGFAENPAGGYRRMGLWVARDGVLVIGQHVGISSSTIVCARSVTIQDHVFIGGGCSIYDTDFHPVTADERQAGEQPRAEAILVKRSSFIGAHSIILKGVTIGERAVVGAGSVVTKDIPDDQVWAGNPAHFIRILEQGDAPMSREGTAIE